MHRAARDAAGRESVRAPLSRAVSRSRSPPPPIALSLARHSVATRVASRRAVRTITRRDSSRTVRTPGSTRTWIYHHFHTAGYFTAKRPARLGDTFRALLSRSLLRRKRKTETRFLTVVSRRFVYRSRTPRDTSPRSSLSLSPSCPCLRFLSPGCFFSSFFLFSFYSARRERRDDADATATVVRCERTRTERRSGSAERRRLPGWFRQRTAIRPSYSSATIPSCTLTARRPFSLLLSPRSRACPSPPRACGP